MKDALNKVQFHYLVKRFHFPERNRLKAFLLKQLKSERRSVEALNFIFCGDDYLRIINKQYLNHHTLTDIITFELSPKGQSLISDVFISVERVKENAFEYSSSFSRELHRVIFHGVLHLVGYKDKNVGEAAEMRRKEEEWLRLYFISRGTYQQTKD